MSELTSELIAELRRLEREVTPGKWRSLKTAAVVKSDDAGCNVHAIYPQPDTTADTKKRWMADARLIAAMRNALPALLDAAEAHLEHEFEMQVLEDWNGRITRKIEP